MPKACIVPNCWKTTKNDTIKCSVFKVPQDEELRRKWQAAIPGNQVLKTSQHVCERHFEPQCILRNLVRRGPDGQILIDITYKRPRLLMPVVPSIFGYEVQAHHANTDNENKPIVVNKIATNVSEECCVVPKTPLLTTIKNEQDAANSFFDQSCAEEDTKWPLLYTHAQHQFYDEFQLTNEAERINSLANNSSTTAESHFTSDDLHLSFYVMNDSQVHFASINGACSVRLPNSWSIVESSTEPKLLMLSQITINDNVAAICKGIVIDERRKIEYAVHGQPVRHRVPGLPQALTDPQALPQIVNDFCVLHVCDGLRDTNISIAEADTVCNDTMNTSRSTKCMLIGKRKTCNSCARLRKTLRQKNIRYTKYNESKSTSTPSNPVDRKKMKGVQLKMNRERRVKTVERDA